MTKFYTRGDITFTFEVDTELPEGTNLSELHKVLEDALRQVVEYDLLPSSSDNTNEITFSNMESHITFYVGKEPF